MNSVIAGDFNICLLKEDFSDITRSLINMMRSFHFHPDITRPTRIDKNDTLSLIDHIWTNNDMTTDKGIFITDITDHFPVFCNLSTPQITKNNLVKIQFRDMSKKNHTKFLNLLSDTNWTNAIEISHNPNNQTEWLSDKLDGLFNCYFPIKTKLLTTKRLSRPWLTKAILKSIDRKHALYKRVKQRTYDQTGYNIYRRILTNLIRVAKVNYYNSKFEHCKQDIKQTWKLINSVLKPGKKHTSLHKIIHNNILITDPRHIANSLNLHFSNIGNKLKNALPVNNATNFSSYLPPSNPSSIYLSPSTPLEVTNIIKGLKNKKQNIHSLPVKLFKQNAEILSNPISAIFNNIITSGLYPDKLKIACVTALFKSGDKCDVNNYRPISSLPLLNMIFEKLLHARLNSFFESSKVYSACQYGFRRGVCTSDAVNKLLKNIYNSINQNMYLGAVFLDLSKAFDTVSHDILIKKLEHYGVRGTTLLLLKSYLSNRKQFVTINGTKSDIHDITIGVPQGSVLGPLLFLIFINDLPLSVKNLKSILFADDTTMHFSHKNIHTLVSTITSDLVHVNNWLLSNQLTLNVRKTYYIIFSLKKVPPNLRLTIGDNEIERHQFGKFLGVILDEKLY